MKSVRSFEVPNDAMTTTWCQLFFNFFFFKTSSNTDNIVDILYTRYMSNQSDHINIKSNYSQQIKQQNQI